MKRILIILLSAAVLFTFMPAAGFAATKQVSDSQAVSYEDEHVISHEIGTNSTRTPLNVKSLEKPIGTMGWETDGEWYWYVDSNTGNRLTGWHKIGGYWYYFAKEEDPNGWETGCIYDIGPMEVNGKWYYFGRWDGPVAKWGKLQYGWIKDTYYNEDGLWFYGDPNNDGQLARGWKKINNKWYFFGIEMDDPIGQFIMCYDGIYEINGYNYYFGKDGDMKTGWVKETYNETYEDGSKDTYVYWYYADPNNDSRLATGWKKIGGKWYWFYEDGEMFDNDTREINGKRYAFNRDGSLHETAGWVDLYEDWIDSNGKTVKESYWVYTDKYGVVKTGWQKISGEWYYFSEYGYMYYNEWAYDSKGACWMGSNGKITKSKWIKDPSDGEWYYCKANGYRAENEWTKDSAGWMYMDEYGIITRNAWAKDSKGWCWMDDDGRITKNEWVDDGNHYVGSDGYMYANCEMEIDGNIYYFDEDGNAALIDPHS